MNSTAMTSTKVLTASCHCRSVQFTISVPVNSLPLNAYLCHCSICRHVHGAPCAFHAQLPSGVQPQFIAPSSLADLTAYNHADSTYTRHFCSTCGCQIADRSHDNGDWVISTAIFDANMKDEGIWKFKTHFHSDTSLDKGLAAFVSTIDGHRLEIVNAEQPRFSTALRPQEGVSEDKELLAQCHCGGVSFHISRPKADFVKEPAGQAWVSPLDKSKWLACMDTCDDCRLVNGTHVIGWLFVPVSHLSPTPPADLMIGSSKVYRSTADVKRTFCGTCGATVFYSCDERPGIVDIATGLLRAPEGIMAETWAFWRAGRLAWPQNGLRYHAGFTQALMEGFKQWGEERGQVQDFVIP